MDRSEPSMSVLNDITVRRAKPRAAKYEVTCEAVRGFVLRVLPSGRKVYFVRHRQDGRDVRVRIGPADRMTCNEARSRAMAILDGSDRPATTPPTSAPRPAPSPAPERAPRSPAPRDRKPTLAEFVARYDREHIVHQLKPSTARMYRYQMGANLLPAMGHLPLDQIAPVDVERLHASMSSTPGQANNVVRLLSHMFTKAIDWQVFPRDYPKPTRTVRFYRERSRERFLTPEERGRLAQVLADAERTPAGKRGSFGWATVAGIRLLALTGMRRNEVLGLTWSMVDTRHRCFRLPDSKTGQRVVPISSQVIDYLALLREKRDLNIPWIVHTHTGRCIDGPQLSRAWINLRKLAGLDDVRLHDLRHSAASDALMAGVTLEELAKILGHSSTRMTARYAHFSDRALRDAVDKMGASIAAAEATVTTTTRRRRGRPTRGEILR